jgi:hypothetical protein
MKLDDGFVVDSVPDESLINFTLFETPARFYILGECSNGMHKILKLDRNSLDGVTMQQLEGTFSRAQVISLNPKHFQ